MYVVVYVRRWCITTIMHLIGFFKNNDEFNLILLLYSHYTILYARLVKVSYRFTYIIKYSYAHR